MKFTGASLPKDQGGSATLVRLVGGIRNAGVFAAVAALAAGVVCMGCGGGGGDDGSTSATATTHEVPTVTQQAESAQDGGSTSNTPSTPESDPGNGAGQGGGSSQSQPVPQQLGSFRDCLSRQGVSLQDLMGPAALRKQRSDPEGFRAQVEKAFTCIPQLPPQLQERAEQLKRRFEQSHR
jgi:hypothetical protein